MAPAFSAALHLSSPAALPLPQALSKQQKQAHLGPLDQCGSLASRPGRLSSSSRESFPWACRGGSAPAGVSRPRAAAAAVISAVAVGQEGFAQEETAKFLRELPQILEREAPGGGDAVKAAGVCAQPLSEFLQQYQGQIVPEPFSAMKTALTAQGTPEAYAETVLRCALGWARTNLYNDWAKWSKGQS